MPTERDRTTSKDVGAARERSPAVELLIVAAPAVATMTSYSVMQFVDKWMLSRLGAEELAAAGNGGLAAFVPASVMMGVLGVVNTFVSQNLGADRAERGAAYAWNGLWLTVLVWAAFLLPMAAALPWVFDGMRATIAFGQDLVGQTLVADEVTEELARQEVVYGRILLVGMVVMLAARGIGHYFYGMHRANVVLIATLAGNVVNILATYLLVFGSAGLPGLTLFGREVDLPGLALPWAESGWALGVAGAAIGTVVGSCVEAVIPLWLFLSKKYDRLFKTRSAWRPSWRHVKDILRIGWPPGLMFGNEMICWWILMAGFSASFGAAHNAAGWVALQYMHLSFMPAVGMSIAVTAVVGKRLGAGRPDIAERRAHLGLGMTMGYMGLCALAFVVFREPLMLIFAGEADGSAARDEFVRVGMRILLVAAAFQVFDAVAVTLMGALRGAGDTVWPGVATIVLSWVCIVGGGGLLTANWGAVGSVVAPGVDAEIWLEWGSVGPWIAAAGFIILLALALLYRWRSGRWKRIDLLGERHETGGLADDAGAGALPVAPGADLPLDEGAAAGDDDRNGGPRPA